MENYLNYQQRCIKRAKREKEEVENAKLLVDGILISLSFFWYDCNDGYFKLDVH